MHIRLIPQYIVWHYTKGIRDVCVVMLRVVQAVLTLFSFRLLLATFFQPFERLGESYNGLHHFFETFIVNTLMRMVGIIVRSALIVMGIVAMGCVILFAMMCIVAWCVAPLIIVLLLYVALITIIKIL